MDTINIPVIATIWAYPYMDDSYPITKHFLVQVPISENLERDVRDKINTHLNEISDEYGGTTYSLSDFEFFQPI